jgi:hypothetical protein
VFHTASSHIRFRGSLAPLIRSLGQGPMPRAPLGLRDSGRAQSAVPRAPSPGDLVALVVQPVRGVEHAFRRGRAGHVPSRASAFAGACAVFVQVIRGVVHARIRGYARRTEMEACACTARQAGEIAVGTRVKRARRRKTADRWQHDGGIAADAGTDGCRLGRIDGIPRTGRRRPGMLRVRRTSASHTQHRSNHNHMAHRPTIARWITKRSFVEQSHMG